MIPHALELGPIGLPQRVHTDLRPERVVANAALNGKPSFRLTAWMDRRGTTTTH